MSQLHNISVVIQKKSCMRNHTGDPVHHNYDANHSNGERDL